jgi:MFS family permease
LFDLVEPGSYGRAAGAERAGDNAGALGGPLLASLLLTVVGIRTTLYLSAIPGVLAAIAITIAGREARRSLSAHSGRRTLSLNVRALRDAGLARALAPAAAFELGNIAATLLILRSTELLHTGGRSLTQAAALAVLLYAAHNGAAAVASLGGGHCADRRGPRLVFGVAAAVYAASYALFAVGSHSWPVLLVGFVAAGVGIGLAETAESTMIAQIAPAELRGSAFGLLGLTQALGDLGSSAVVGALWAGLAPSVGFGYAAGWMAIAVVAVTLLARSAATARPRT